MINLIALADELDRRALLELRKRSAIRRVAAARHRTSADTRRHPAKSRFPGKHSSDHARHRRRHQSKYDSGQPIDASAQTTVGPSPTSSPPVAGTNAADDTSNSAANGSSPISQSASTSWRWPCRPSFVIDGFDSGDYRLRPHQFGMLRQAVRAFQAAAASGPVSIALQGHASADGPEDANRVLSFLRAAAVRWVFNEVAEKLGIKAVRYQLKGAGETLPVAAGDSVDTRRRNRRVEIAVCPGA